ncbi:G-protein coupled receptor GRL101-like protein [Trichoplax sp. H2]|nr:G-protein coupled receptor GRL101-like protein [Trichoplax sp. H2]|eukprot:RDD36407.1 G-protein coupled receptor GRL101-like protein [Trichoplax sp. H2]
MQLVILPNYIASAIIAWIFGIVGILANGYVIYCNGMKLKYYSQSMNKVHIFLIMNLALADGFGALYLLILCIADLVYSQYPKYHLCYSNKSCTGNNNSWLLNPGCFIAKFSSTIAIFLPALLTLLIAIDSYFCIVKQKYRRLLSFPRAKFLTAIIWIFGCSLGLILAIRSYQYHDPENFRGWTNLCYTGGLEDSVMRIIHYATYLIMPIPYFITISIYFAIVDRVRRSRSNRIFISHHSVNSEKFVGLITGIIAFTNLLSWLPAIVLGIGQIRKVKSLKTPAGYALTGLFYLLFFVNSATNPLIYTVLTRRRCKRCL